MTYCTIQVPRETTNYHQSIICVVNLRQRSVFIWYFHAMVRFDTETGNSSLLLISSPACLCQNLDWVLISKHYLKELYDPKNILRHLWSVVLLPQPNSASTWVGSDLIMGRNPPTPSHPPGTFKALPGNLGRWFAVVNSRENSMGNLMSREQNAKLGLMVGGSYFFRLCLLSCPPFLI